jgi:DNA-binding response OmpR family regulator
MPDLVVGDIRMPQVDGFEFLAAARTRSPLCPFVVISAKAADADVWMGRSLGADDDWVKPFDPAHLVKAVHSHREGAGRVRALLVERSPS